MLQFSTGISRRRRRAERIFASGPAGRFSTRYAWATGRLLLCLALLLNLRATAQTGTPTWQTAMATNATMMSGTARVRTSTADASGNLYVAGFFTGQVGFGSITLTSAGGEDAFVAKWDATTGHWVWALAGGGTAADQVGGIAVRGSTIYVSGFITNNNADANGGSNVQFGSVPLPGASSTTSQDVFVAHITDPATGVPTDWAWALAGGGTAADQTTSIAVNGSAVYVSGYITGSATFGSTNLVRPAEITSAYLSSIELPTAPLPVELTEFTATLSGEATVRLAWATASEKNSASFATERSTDGQAFTTIGTVAAAGSSTARRRYSWVDAQLPIGASVLYYRLRQVDADGTTSYSPVRAVSVANAVGLQLYPNPASDAATLIGAQPGALVQIFDGLGRVVLTAQADATGTARLTLPAGQRAGLYLVRSGAQVVRLVRE